MAFDIIVMIVHNPKNSEIVFVTLHNLSLISSFFRENSDWGGVAIYSSKNVFYRIKPLDWVSKSSFERIWSLLKRVLNLAGVLVSENNRKIVLLGVCHPPKSNIDIFLETLDLVLHKSFSKFNYVIVGCDVNVNILNSNPEVTQLLDLVYSYDLEVNVNAPTQIGAT